MTPRAAAEPPVDIEIETLDRYLAGVSTADERMRIEQWLATAPDAATVLGALRRASTAGTSPVLPAEVESEWVRLAHALETLGPVGTSRAPARVIPLLGARIAQRRIPQRVVLAIAAAVLVSTGIALSWRQLHQRETNTTLVLHEFTTGRAQRARVALDDGTQVTLAPDSRLRVIPTATSARTVELNGEAEFDVRHDARRPFTVRTGYAVITDIGTRFDVRAYRTDRTVRVAVAEGQVSVTHHGGVLLTPGEAAFAFDTGLTVAHNANVAAFTAWTHGRLVFDNAPLDEVAATLTRWYDVDVRLGDPTLSARRLTASYDDEPLSTVLPFMTRVLEVRATWRGRTVILTPSPTAISQP